MMQLITKATTFKDETINIEAKPYTKKLPASPVIMRMIPADQYGDLRYDFLSEESFCFSDCFTVGSEDERECIEGCGM